MRQALAAAAAIAALALAGGASAGTLTLEPRGTDGAQAHWQAQEGIPDAQGNADQALYFESVGPLAAAQAIVHGVEGMRASALTGLEWEHRIDGRCDSKSPRWTVYLRAGATPLTPVRFGCALAFHSPGSAPGWIRDTNPQAAILRRILVTVGAVGMKATVVGLSIDFDSKGFIFLDNIRVNDDVWRFAGDNGNGPQDASMLTSEELAAAGADFTAGELFSAEELLAMDLDTSEAFLP